MLLSGFGGVFTAALIAARKRRCASASLYWSESFFVIEGCSLSTENQATWWDHRQLNFWLWAAIHDGNQYLAASTNVRMLARAMATPTTLAIRVRLRQQWDEALQLVDLQGYHFIVSLGRAMPILQRAQHLFPTIQPIYSKSNHLINEARPLRNMVEHSHEYLRGEGWDQQNFHREGPTVNLPGDQPGTADAISTVTNDEGHWLGGRLCVEKALKELTALLDHARTIPAPLS